MAKKVSRPTQITRIKKDKFVTLYRETRGMITDICSAVGIARKTYYNWLEADNEFAMAIADCEAEINDEIKQLLIQNAGENNMTAIIFWLKNKHPEFLERNTYVFQNIDKQLNIKSYDGSTIN